MASRVFVLRVFRFFASFLILLLTLELGLRVQQWAGPFYDLEFDFLEEQTSYLSNVLNHVPARSLETILEDAAIFGEHAGMRYMVRYNSDGIRLNGLRPKPTPDREDVTTILFLGDSFTQGYDDENTLPHRTWEHLKGLFPESRLQILNAGVSSYSPAILIPLAQQLLPLYRPDIVVVVIDETDLGDDYIRYEHLIRRNLAGDVVAVQASPPAIEFLAGFRRIQSHSLYMVRVAHKLYHTRVHLPSFEAGYRAWYSEFDVLRFSSDRNQDIAERYATEIAVFRRNLFELGRVLKESLPDVGRALFVRHPHLGHLRGQDDPRRWNNLVSRTLEVVVEEVEIPYYNTETDMRIAFGSQPERYFWNGDMHFNFRGVSEYGRLLAARMAPMLAKMEATNESRDED